MVTGSSAGTAIMVLLALFMIALATGIVLITNPPNRWVDKMDRRKRNEERKAEDDHSR